MHLCIFLILFILIQKPCSIYTIIQIINTELGFSIHISSGTVVPCIKKLEKSGFITEEKTLTDGGFRKNNYKITQKGKEYFENIIKIPISKSPQSASKEISVFLSLINSEIFTKEQKNIVKNKIKLYLEKEVFKFKNLLKTELQYSSYEFIKLKTEYLSSLLNYLNNIEHYCPNKI